MDKRVFIRSLQRRDVEAMTAWGVHQDPLFQHYNFPKLTEGERGLWYWTKTSGIKKRCYAVLNQEDEVIGYISMKHINHFRRSSELGIVLDPSVVGKGYGPLALKTFMDMYFGRMKMERLYLKAAKFNERAVKAYIKSGFAVEREIVEVFEEQEIQESLIRRIMKSNPYIFYEKGRIYCHYYFMSIDSKEWFSPQRNQDC